MDLLDVVEEDVVVLRVELVVVGLLLVVLWEVVEELVVVGLLLVVLDDVVDGVVDWVVERVVDGVVD